MSLAPQSSGICRKHEKVAAFRPPKHIKNSGDLSVPGTVPGTDSDHASGTALGLTAEPARSYVATGKRGAK